MDMNTWKEGDYEVFSHAIGDVIKKREGAREAIDALIDSAGESWFDLGQKLERQRVNNVLDNFEKRLLDSEEDAKMTLAVLRKLIEDGEEEEDGAGA